MHLSFNLWEERHFMSKVSAQREKATKSPLRIEWRGLNCYFHKGYWRSPNVTHRLSINLGHEERKWVPGYFILRMSAWRSSKDSVFRQCNRDAPPQRWVHSPLRLKMPSWHFCAVLRNRIQEPLTCSQTQNKISRDSFFFSFTFPT